jgi:YegS/Rv2252/BmrU family lipid kinase
LAKKTISFIINPISGTHKKDSLPEIIRQTIDPLQFDVRIFFTERAGHATQLAQQEIEKGVSCIVAVGGDGTVNEVAMAVRDTPTVMGIVPCGSGNGLARHLHISLKITDALRLIHGSSVIRIDYGIVNDIPFFCTFGVGFDAHISHVFARKKIRGLITYMLIIIKEFFRYRSKKYKLIVDGEKFKTRALLVTIANSAQYGNSGYIAPHADITDGKLDVCIVNPLPKFRGMFFAIRLLCKRIDKSKYYRMVKGKKIVIRRKHEGEVHLDGEPYTMGKKMKIKIVPEGLNIIAGTDFVR